MRWCAESDCPHKAETAKRIAHHARNVEKNNKDESDPEEIERRRERRREQIRLAQRRYRDKHGSKEKKSKK